MAKKSVDKKAPEEDPSEAHDGSPAVQDSLPGDEPEAAHVPVAEELEPEPETTVAVAQPQETAEEAADSIPVAHLATEEVEELTGLTLHDEVEADSKDSYFEDDEEFLKSSDRTLEERPDAALVQQLDNVVSYNLTNFYGEDGKRRSKYALKSDPPVFRVESSSGDYAEFLVTPQLSEHLAQLFDSVRRGYYGVDPKTKKSSDGSPPKNKLVELTRTVEAHPVRTIVIAVVIVFAILSAFLI